MNFKAFLKNNLISESLVLFEDAESDKQKDAFIRSAYKRIIPNGSEKADVDKMWNAIRSKAYYKLSQNSKPETRKAVQQAKGALSRGKQFGLKSDEPETEEKDKTVSKKILDHLEDWTEEDFKQLEDSIQNSKSSFVLNSVTSLEDLKNISDTLEPKDQELLFDLIKKQEHEVEGEIDWKDKTFDDLESIDNEDFNKIKDSLNGTLGVEIKDLNDLKSYIKDNKIDDSKLKELDNLLDSKTPEEPKKSSQENQHNADNETILNSIQEKQREEELNSHLAKIGLDSEALVSGDPEVTQKIMDSGDPVLYDTFITNNLPEESPVVQRVKKEQEERLEVQRKEMERRTERFESLKETGKALAGVAVMLDFLKSALTGKGDNFFEASVKKQSDAKKIAEGITGALNTRYETELNKQEDHHNKELEALKADLDNRLKKLDELKADPEATVAYKKLVSQATQKFKETSETLKNETKEASNLVAKVSPLAVFMANDDLSVLEPNQKSQMVEVLSEKFPRKDGDERAESSESDDEFLERIKNEISNDDIQKIIDEANNDLSQCREKEKELNDVFNKSLEDLKNNSEVQDEIKLSEANYKNQKAIIESEYDKALASENERFERTTHCLKKTMEENKRFTKNISVLAMFSADPQNIVLQEIASRNKRLQDRAKLEVGVEIFNEENCPSDIEQLSDMFEKAGKEDSSSSYNRESQDVHGDSEQSENDSEQSENDSEQSEKWEPSDFESIEDIVEPDTKIKVNGKDIPLTSDNFEEIKDTEEFKQFLQSPEVLKKLSKKEELKDEDVENGLDGLEGDIQDLKTPLKEMNFKTLWSLLNKEGISIKVLPGYSSDMSPEQKADLIRDYIKEHKVGNWSNLEESKTPQGRLSSLIEANDRKIQKGSLKKFAELLVNDVRTFG